MNPQYPEVRARGWIYGRHLHENNVSVFSGKIMQAGGPSDSETAGNWAGQQSGCSTEAPSHCAVGGGTLEWLGVGDSSREHSNAHVCQVSVPFAAQLLPWSGIWSWATSHAVSLVWCLLQKVLMSEFVGSTGPQY